MGKRGHTHSLFHSKVNKKSMYLEKYLKYDNFGFSYKVFPFILVIQFLDYSN